MSQSTAMPDALRKSGIPPVGDIPWGTHFCHFFESDDDLCDTVVPYLIAGIEGRELCVWLTSNLPEEECIAALRSRGGSEVERHLAEGSLRLHEAAEWYRREGVFDSGAIRTVWTDLLTDARNRGFVGVRVAGCESWLEPTEHPDFAQYEGELEQTVKGQPLILLCSYRLHETGAAGLLDVAQTHDFALAKRDGQWEMVETPAVRLRQIDMRRRQQAAIATLGLAAVRSNDFDALLDQAASLAASTLGTGRSIVWRLRPDHDDLILCASTGWDELPPGATIPYTEGTPTHYGFTRDQPVVIIDVPSHPRFHDLSWLLRDYGVITLLSAVIRGRERPWGALSVHSMTRRAFTDDDLEFLQSMANVVALAIERNRLELAERQEKEMAESALARLHAIESITDTAIARLELDTLLEELLGRLRKSLEADCSAVMLFDEQHTSLTVRAGDGFPISRAIGLRIPVTGPMAASILRTGEAVILNDVEFPPLATLITGAPIRSAMGAPLIADDKMIGIVAVTSEASRRFTEEQLDLLRVVAGRVAPAIERARLLEGIRAAHERLGSLSRRLLSVQEEERRRVAIELHDELGQILTAVKINLGSTPVRLDDAIENVDEAMQTVRHLALELRPAMLDDLGLAAALRWYADRFAQQTRLETHLAIAERVPDLDPGLATACFRVVQEALTNVVRHSSAKNVWIELKRTPAELLLSVRDDGTGFDVAAARQRAIRGASLGLIGMEERVSLAGGRIDIRSAPGAGTAVFARFPIGAA